MGQSNSRYQSEDRFANDGHDLPSTSHTTSTTGPLNAEDESKRNVNNIETDSSGPLGQTRRSLLRRSFLGFGKPSSQSSSREGSLAGSMSNKRSWLNPRRWSRAPSSLAEEFPYSDLPDSQSNASLNGKGKEREEYGDTDAHDIQSNLPTDQQPDPNSFLSSQFVTSPANNDKPEIAEFSEEGPGTVSESLASTLPLEAITQQDNNLQQYLPRSDIIEMPPMDKQNLTPTPLTPNQSVETAANDSATASTIDAPPISGDVTPVPNGVPESNGSTTTTVPLPTTASTRPFPPPGTLVVVQGVVHTTDVPRSSIQNTNANGDGISIDQSMTQPNSPASQERNGTRARSRLSTLLRPRSVGAGPSVPDLGPAGDVTQSIQTGQQADNVGSIVDEAATVSEGCALGRRSSNQSTLSGNDEATAIGSESSPPTMSGEVEWNERQEDADGEPSVNQHNSEDSSGGPISSSSIDVLGTLLSVAAAATAASLLTGSSEPILPSNHSAASSSNFAQNTSTTINATSPDFSASGRAERMRNAWTSIRDRLGIRSSGSSNNANSNNAGAGASAQSAAEAREMMLGEMARAFSVGLGLGSFAGSTSTNNSLLGRSAEVAPSPETRTLATEGSFERFLMDLQADLRVALTTGEGGNGVRAMAAGSGWSDTPSSNETQGQSEGDITIEQGEGDVAASISENPNNFEHQQEDNHNANADQDDVPESEEISDLDDEPVELETETTRADVDGSGDDERQHVDGPGRINWWRLYRFPPIGVPRSNSAASAAAAAALSTNSSDASSTTPVPSSPGQLTEPSSGTGATTLISSAPNGASTHASSTPNIQDSTTNGHNTDAPAHSTVVPVIIVGLQSVHMEWRPDFNANHDHEHYRHHHHEDATDGHLDDGMDDIFGPTPGHDSNPDREAQEPGVTPSTVDASIGATDGEANQQRGRRWRSRAADALRGLRPRRGGEQRNGTGNADAGAPHLTHQMPPMGPGSRMFLIYVIGGYYPPNHSIVLGNPADLESFEALSELADLLGQVKPPTATKEEIEKSGLHVIKASKIGEHEWEGKIAGNCIERCLICLDDYKPEDDVRLMSCRHAFHKDCVDRWLQTGKNNCPACRTKGVSTEARGPFVS